MCAGAGREMPVSPLTVRRKELPAAADGSFRARAPDLEKCRSELSLAVAVHGEMMKLFEEEAMAPRLARELEKCRRELELAQIAQGEAKKLLEEAAQQRVGSPAWTDLSELPGDELICERVRRVPLPGFSRSGSTRRGRILDWNRREEGWMWVPRCQCEGKWGCIRCVGPMGGV